MATSGAAQHSGGPSSMQTDPSVFPRIRYHIPLPGIEAHMKNIRANQRLDCNHYRKDQFLAHNIRYLTCVEATGNIASHQFQRDTVEKNICAFLNSDEGGTIILGVTDKYTVQGIQWSQHVQKAFLDALDSTIKGIYPPVYPNMYEVQILPVQDQLNDQNYDPDKLKVVEITVTQGAQNQLYITRDGIVFLRERSGRVQEKQKDDYYELIKQRKATNIRTEVDRLSDELTHLIQAGVTQFYVGRDEQFTASQKVQKILQAMQGVEQKLKVIEETTLPDMTKKFSIKIEDLSAKATQFDETLKELQKKAIALTTAQNEENKKLENSVTELHSSCKQGFDKKDNEILKISQDKKNNVGRIWKGTNDNSELVNEAEKETQELTETGKKLVLNLEQLEQKVLSLTTTQDSITEQAKELADYQNKATKEFQEKYDQLDKLRQETSKKSTEQMNRLLSKVDKDFDKSTKIFRYTEKLEADMKRIQEVELPWSRDRAEQAHETLDTLNNLTRRSASLMGKINDISRGLGKDSEEYGNKKSKLNRDLQKYEVFAADSHQNHTQTIARSRNYVNERLRTGFANRHGS